MRFRFKQSKTTGVIDLTIRLSFFELLDLSRRLDAASTNSTVVSFLAWIREMPHNVEEPQ